jgi:pyruvate/2-oxoglutarate dehydrogenase complex dihydrolipoamide acyltransferase (E2) component
MKPFISKPLTAIETYMYGLKSRAHLNHCLGNGLLPIDVTELSAVRKQYCRQVRAVTFAPFFIKAVALTIRANPCANRILFQRFPLRRRIVRFDVVDVNVPVTRLINGEQWTFIGTIRGADKLTIAEIQEQLIRLQCDTSEQSPILQKMNKLRNAPPIIASLYHWLIARSPHFYLKNAGTCGVVLMDAMPGGNFFPIGPTTAMFGIGGIGDQVVARNGVPVVRQIAQVSLSLDNYVVTGPEGLALATSFQKLLESSSFAKSELEETAVDPVPEGTNCVSTARPPEQRSRAIS